MHPHIHSKLESSDEMIFLIRSQILSIFRVWSKLLENKVKENSSKCSFSIKGAPVIMSLPHFLFADKEKVIDQVYGVKPDIKRHNTYFNIEPVSISGPTQEYNHITLGIQRSSNMLRLKVWDTRISRLSHMKNWEIKNRKRRRKGIRRKSTRRKA